MPHEPGRATLPAEFDFIARHFRPLAGPAALDLRDDAAILAPPAGRELVLSADAAIAGVHFRPTDPPGLIARKVLRTNLSDLAAMGADPLGYLLTLAIPRGLDDSFFTPFAAGLAEDQRAFGLSLLGGDTTVGSAQLVVSITILGHVAPGTALRRNGAKPGDGLWVTGTIGDAALGLRIDEIDEIGDIGSFLANRYLLPQPRLGLRLHNIADAAMDISDGLVQDCGHLARESGLGIVLDAACVPLSPAARRAGPDWLTLCLTGGDDYELLLAVPPENEPALLAESTRSGLSMTRIGTFSEGSGVVVRDHTGSPMTLTAGGWNHLA